MILPKIGNIYKFKGKTVGVICQTLLFNVYVMEYNYSNNAEGSKFLYINWWSFVKNAKYVGKIKDINTSY